MQFVGEQIQADLLGVMLQAIGNQPPLGLLGRLAALGHARVGKDLAEQHGKAAAENLPPERRSRFVGTNQLVDALDQLAAVLRGADNRRLHRVCLKERGIGIAIAPRHNQKIGVDALLAIVAVQHIRHGDGKVARRERIVFPADHDVRAAGQHADYLDAVMKMRNPLQAVPHPNVQRIHTVLIRNIQSATAFFVQNAQKQNDCDFCLKKLFFLSCILPCFLYNVK